jgi:hypothetical protein
LAVTQALPLATLAVVRQSLVKLPDCDGGQYQCG